MRPKDSTMCFLGDVDRIAVAHRHDRQGKPVTDATFGAVGGPFNPAD